jgi:hypothetical protein
LPIPFVWTRHECEDCHYIWEPKTVREHSIAAIFFTSLLIVLAVTVLFLVPYCQSNYDGSSVFPTSQGCIF